VDVGRERRKRSQRPREWRLGQEGGDEGNVQDLGASLSCSAYSVDRFWCRLEGCPRGRSVSGGERVIC
jgi:hypothetical protein